MPMDIGSEMLKIERIEELQRFLELHGMKLNVNLFDVNWHVTLTLVRPAGSVEAKGRTKNLKSALVLAAQNLDVMTQGRY